MTTQRLLLAEPPDSSIPTAAPELRETFRVLDVVATGWIVVLSFTTTVPPATPNQGDAYLVPAGATGAWAGHQNHLAIFTPVGWIFRSPRFGWIAVVADQNTPYGRVLQYSGTGWTLWLLPAASVSFDTASTDFVSGTLQALMLEINARFLADEAVLDAHELTLADHESRIDAIEAAGGGGGAAGPSLVQAAYQRRTGVQTGSVTLGATPTVGNVLVALCTGFDNGGTLGLPSGFTQVYSATVSSTQGIRIGIRVVRTGDTAGPYGFNGGNGGNTNAILEFSNCQNVTAVAANPASSGNDLTADPVPGINNGYQIGIAESDQTNGYSSIAGATLLFDGTNTADNHPGVIYHIAQMARVVVTYTGSSFGATIGASILVS